MIKFDKQKMDKKIKYMVEFVKSVEDGQVKQNEKTEKGTKAS